MAPGNEEALTLVLCDETERVRTGGERTFS